MQENLAAEEILIKMEIRRNQRRKEAKMMKLVKVIVALAVAAGVLSLGACASKPAPSTPAPTVYKK